MAEKPILLVLGAGASVDYGFPLGDQLIFRIQKQMKGKTKQVEVLQSLGYDRVLLGSFADTLIASHQPSIDAFLALRPEFHQIGKHILAAVMISHEGQANLERQERVRWYEYLWTRLISPTADSFPAIPISILTFNYDRSLERFLEIAIKAAYGVTDEQASSMRMRIEIHHVYGLLAPLGPSNTSKTRAYNTDLVPMTVETAASYLKVIGEPRTDNDSLERTRKLFRSSKTIAFLGFGFHPDNVKLLGYNHDDGQKIYGTAFHATDNQRGAIANMFNGHIDHLDCDCLKLLQNCDVIG